MFLFPDMQSIQAVCQSIINMVKFKPSFALSLVEALVESLQSANGLRSLPEFNAVAWFSLSLGLAYRLV